MTDPAIRREPQGYATIADLRSVEARLTTQIAACRADSEAGRADLRSHVDATTGGLGGRLGTIETTIQDVAQDVGAIRLAVLETPSRRIVDALLRNTVTTLGTLAAITLIGVLGLALLSGLDVGSIMYEGGGGKFSVSAKEAQAPPPSPPSATKRETPTEGDNDGAGSLDTDGAWWVPPGPALAP